MEGNSALSLASRSCIGCKKGASAQWTMYECRCCSVTICPECICAAQLKMTSLVKIDSGSTSAKSEDVQITRSIPTATSGEPVRDPIVAVRTASMPVRVKRKPIPGTASNTTSPTTPAVRQQPFDSSTTASQPTSPAMSYPSQAAQYVAGRPPKPGDQPIQTAPATVASSHTGAAPASPPSGQLASIPHARIEPIVQTTSPVSPRRTQEPSLGFPQLQQVRTAPELTNIGAEIHPSSSEKRPRMRRSARSQPVSFSSIKRKHPVTVNNIRRASHASVATAKKLSQNPWVRAGVKIGARYALKQVIGDVASDLMVNNVAGGAVNAASGLFSNNSSSSPTDLASGLFDNNSSPTDLTSGLFANNDNSNSSNNVPDPGTTLDNFNAYGNSSSSNVPDPGTLLDNFNAYGNSSSSNVPDPGTMMDNFNAYGNGNSIGGSYSPPLSPVGPSLMYQAPGFTTPPNTNNNSSLLNAPFLGQTQYPLFTQNVPAPFDPYGDPNVNNSLPGDYPDPSILQYNNDDIISQQQLAAATEQNILYSQDAIDASTANSAMQVSQMFCADEVSNADAVVADAGNAV